MASKNSSKQPIVVQPASKTPVSLASLASLATPAAAPPPSGKKANRPAEHLTGTLALDHKKLTAAKMVVGFCEPIIDSVMGAVKEKGRLVWATLGFKMRCVPPNPSLMTDRSSTTHCETTGQKVRILVPEGVTVLDALLSAGVSKATANIIAPLVETIPCTTINSLQELNQNTETQPLVQKVVDFIGKLSADEIAVLINNKPKRVVGEGFFQAMFENAKSVEEILATVSVISPQMTTTSSKFNGSLEDALKVVQDVDETAGEATVETVVTKTTKTAAAA